MRFRAIHVRGRLVDLRLQKFHLLRALFRVRQRTLHARRAGMDMRREMACLRRCVPGLLRAAMEVKGGADPGE